MERFIASRVGRLRDTIKSIVPKILVVGPSWVGDTVLAQPLFKRLHERLSNLTLDIFAPEWAAPLLKRMPEVNQVIPNPFRHGELKLWERRRLGRNLKPQRYDQAIVLPNSLKSALVPFYAGIKFRTGYRGEARYWLINDMRVLDEAALPTMAERFVQLAEKPGEALARPLPKTELQADEQSRQNTLSKLGLALQKPVAALCPGAEYGPAKRWPAAHYAELAKHLQREGFAVWLIGSPKDDAIGEEIRRESGDLAVNLCGKTSLSEAIDLLSCASLVVSNDSGLMHVAAALDKPMIALYGSSSPKFTPPLSSKARVLKLDLPCSPCFERVCPLKHFKCMNDLTPQRVYEETMRIWH